MFCPTAPGTVIVYEPAAGMFEGSGKIGPPPAPRAMSKPACWTWTGKFASFDIAVMLPGAFAMASNCVLYCGPCAASKQVPLNVSALGPHDPGTGPPQLLCVTVTVFS